MKHLFLLVKPLAAFATFGTITFHTGHTTSDPTLMRFASPAVAGRGDPSSSPVDAYTWVAGRGDPSSSSGGATTSGSEWWYRSKSYAGIGDFFRPGHPTPTFTHDRIDLLWHRLRLRDLPEGIDTWRPWQR